MGKLSLVILALAGCATKTTTTNASSACLGDVSSSSLAGYSQDFVRHVADSAYIIRAHVTAVDATTLPNETPTPNLVIAQVDAVAYHDAEIDQLLGTWGPGATVTIDLDAPNLAVGDAAYFFTTIEEFNGGQLEVSEIGREAPEPMYDATIPRMHAMLVANPLYAAIATSVAVVTADVGAVGAADENCGSEHCASWQPANLDAVTALCGNPVATASFASSDDVAWYQSPKLVAGQTGVFLVHHPEDEGATAAIFGTAPSLTLARAIDVHPMADEAEITALLASPPTF